MPVFRTFFCASSLFCEVLDVVILAALGSEPESPGATGKAERAETPGLEPSRGGAGFGSERRFSVRRPQRNSQHSAPGHGRALALNKETKPFFDRIRMSPQCQTRLAAFPAFMIRCARRVWFCRVWGTNADIAPACSPAGTTRPERLAPAQRDTLTTHYWCVFAVGRRSARHSSLQAARLQARNSTNLPGRPFRPGRREKGGQPRT